MPHAPASGIRRAYFKTARQGQQLYDTMRTLKYRHVFYGRCINGFILEWVV